MRPAARSIANLNKVHKPKVYDLTLNDSATLAPANAKLLSNGETSILVPVDHNNRKKAW